MSTVTIDSGPRNAFIEKGTGLRFYDWQGRALPSVTSLRNMAGQPHALVAWKLARVIDRACGRILKDADGKETGWEEGSLSELTAMLTRERRPRERVLEKNRIKEARAFLHAAHEEERDRASARGTAVHKAAEHGTPIGELEDYTDPESGIVILADEYRAPYRQFLAFLEETGAEILLNERQVWNLTLGYAGSFDILVRFGDGSLWIIDLKTGAHIYSDHVLQQMAYRRAEFIGSDGIIDEAATALLHAVSGIALLHLSDDGWSFHRLVDDEDAWQAFVGLLRFATWTREHETAESFTTASGNGAAVDEPHEHRWHASPAAREDGSPERCECGAVA